MVESTVETQRGKPRIGVEIAKSFTLHPVDGQVSSGGVQFSSVATFGTTPVEIFNKVINPGYNQQLTELEANLEANFEGLNGSFVGSINYQWEMQEAFRTSEGTVLTGTLISVSGTIEDAMGTLANITRSLEGYIPIGSVPHSPVRLILTVAGLRASVGVAKVTNNSYVRLVGNILPGGG